MALSSDTRAKLATVSTATITTALLKRGLRNQFMQNVLPLDPTKPTMVGEAFTLRYIPAREDLNPLTVFQDRNHPQRKPIEQCPPGAIMVFDSRKDARAASAGSILVTRLMMRGVAGVVTDGGFRDSGEIARLAIPAYHQRPAAPTNLTLHQALDINVPIGCGDAPVWPGDVLVGDADGVVVVPAHLADEIAAEAVEMTAFEDYVTEKVREDLAILGLYPATEERAKAGFDFMEQTSLTSRECYFPSSELRRLRSPQDQVATTPNFRLQQGISQCSGRAIVSHTCRCEVAGKFPSLVSFEIEDLWIILWKILGRSGSNFCVRRFSLRSIQT